MRASRLPLEFFQIDSLCVIESHVLTSEESALHLVATLAR